MRRSTKPRLTRELAGSLLKSNLSEKELVDLCHDILNNGSIIHDVAMNILNLVNVNVNLDRHSSNERNYSKRVQSEAVDVYNILKRKGVTKDKLFIALSLFSSDMDNFIGERRPTIREVMEYFIDSSSKNEVHHFINSFNDDEFIQMIEDE